VYQNPLPLWGRVRVGERTGERFGKWCTLYRRFRHWIDLGIFDLIEKEPQTQVIDRKGVKTLALDSTSVKVHPNGKRR
jgi:muconolactone delta-isomerase